MKIGMMELLVIFIVALVVIGPDKLPAYAHKRGEALRQFKKYSSEATKDIREGIVEPLEEAQRPLKEALKPVNDLEKELKSEVKDLKKSLQDVGKPVKAEAPGTDDASEDVSAGPGQAASVQPEAAAADAAEETMSGTDTESDT